MPQWRFEPGYLRRWSVNGSGREGRARTCLTSIDGLTNRKTPAQSLLCGGGRESNPPTESPRRTGFEDQEGHQAPVASAGQLSNGLEQTAPARGSAQKHVTMVW